MTDAVAAPLTRLVARRQRPAAWGAGVLFACHQLGEVAVPIVIGETIDRAIAPGDRAAMVRWMAVLVAVFVFLSSSWRLGARLSELAEANVDHDLRVALTGRIVDRRGLAGPPRHRGDLLSLASNDTQPVAWGTSVPANACAAVVALVATCIALMRIAWELGLLVVLGSSAVLALAGAASGVVERRTSDAQRRAAESGAAATDIVVGVRVIHGLGAEEAAAARYVDASRALLRATLSVARVESGIAAATTAMTGALLGMVALAGAHLAERGSITVGQLVTAFALAQFLIGPWERLREAVGIAAHARASRQRLDAVLGAGPSDPRHAPRPAVEVEPGELVAVYTASPAEGDALARALAAHGGPNTLVAPRHAEVFGGPVLDNVRAVASDDTLVARAVAAALADDVVRSAPGAERSVTAHGMSLSGGQRQRIALARALAAAPELLVLVEPTSSVDAATEARIVERVRDMRSGSATLVVTTSRAWLAAADRVLVPEREAG